MLVVMWIEWWGVSHSVRRRMSKPLLMPLPLLLLLVMLLLLLLIEMGLLLLLVKLLFGPPRYQSPWRPLTERDLDQARAPSCRRTFGCVGVQLLDAD